jgi:hypothetical protein
MQGKETEAITLTFSGWKSLGKPSNLEQYRAAAARAETGERREFDRFEASFKVRLSRIPSGLNEPAQREDTETEVIARGGALVRSRMALESGELLVFELGAFKTRGEVRYVSTSSAVEDFQRVGLKFIDALLPDDLLPAGAQPLP